MHCPKCQFENPEDSNFCLECGQKLEKKCPQCDKVLPVIAKFCNGCGHKLDAPVETSPKDLSFDEKLSKVQKYLPKGLTEKILSQKDRIEGERKQVTVMFCDMAGFTPLVEKLDSENAYDIMDQVYEILIHKVHEYEGTVNEMTGDGIMALFGAPIAKFCSDRQHFLTLRTFFFKFLATLKTEIGVLWILKLTFWAFHFYALH